MKYKKKKKEKCTKKKKDGTYCKAYQSGKIGLCVFHERQFKAQQRKDKDNRAIQEGREPEKPVAIYKVKPVKKPVAEKEDTPPVEIITPTTIQGLIDLVASTLAAVQGGKVSEKKATSITKLAKIQLDLLNKLPPVEKDDDVNIRKQIDEQLAMLNKPRKDDA